MIAYDKLSIRELLKILWCTPPDTPHWQRARVELERRMRFQAILVAVAAVIVAILRMAIR